MCYKKAITFRAPASEKPGRGMRVAGETFNHRLK